jgi:hypothetical protein
MIPVNRMKNHTTQSVEKADCMEESVSSIGRLLTAA